MQSDLPAIPRLKIKFWVFIILAILSLLLIRYWSNGLSGSTIVDFEMAKKVEKADAMMVAWGEEGKNNKYPEFYFSFMLWGRIFLR